MNKVLLVEDNPGDARLIEELLKEAAAGEFGLHCVGRISEAMRSLAEGDYSAVLLDLSLPDSAGLETVQRLCRAAKEVPIVVLTGMDDESLALEAVQQGAQDYLVKGRLEAPHLLRSIRHAIERSRVRTELLSQSLTDGLTGLSNRRGFMTLANQQIVLANRTQRGMILLYIDLDNLKRINDTLGHQVGDLALIETAGVLRESFRMSDIMGRVGGDEFAVLAIEAPAPSAQLLVGRLKRNILARNSQKNRLYDLSLSVGSSRYDPASPSPIDVLMARADAAMYMVKRDKRRHLSEA